MISCLQNNHSKSLTVEGRSNVNVFTHSGYCLIRVQNVDSMLFSQSTVSSFPRYSSVEMFTASNGSGDLRRRSIRSDFMALLISGVSGAKTGESMDWLCVRTNT